MGLGFNSAAHKDSSSVVSLEALRGQTMKRLAGVQQSLENKGVGAAFIRAAKSDPIGDMGFMGGLIVSMILGGSVTAFMSGSGLSGAFNGLSAAMEGVSALRDEKVNTYRNRKLNDYPEGRRKCALAAAKVAPKFNIVSANQNNRFSYDVQADLACMFEILDMLDQLEKEGVSVVRLDKQESVYSALKQTTGQMFRKGIVRNYAMPMLKAV